MKMVKNYIPFLLSLLMFISCEKTGEFTDVSFVQTAAPPTAIAVLPTITQDNSGMVTLLPNGEGAVKYEIYFGDNTAQPAIVKAGESVTHKYAEGNFNVRVVGFNLNGQTSEKIQAITVSFRQPENFVANVAIDNVDKFKVNVSAKADFETNFTVLFGDVVNETPKSFMEGETISHTYTKTGTYKVKVTALSGGAATAVYEKTIEITDPVLLPLTFESATIKYEFTNFGGGMATVVDNPYKTGINTSAKVGRMVKNAGEGWGGSWIGLGGAIDFSENKIFRMKVYSPRVGAKVLLKVENASNSSLNFEKEMVTTVANAWEDMVFDYSGINTANTYERIVLIFELGTPGDGSSNFTFYFDDIRLTKTLPAETLALPLTFESAVLNYAFFNFDGGEVTIVDNPSKTGINTSNKVAKMIKKSGQPWGGSFIALPDPINFSGGKMIKVKVWSPRVGAKMLFKVENATDGGINFEKEVTTTKANEWEELTFDYSAINTANSYSKIVLIFELGTVGDGSENFTFYFDDIQLN